MIRPEERPSNSIMVAIREHINHALTEGPETFSYDLVYEEGFSR